MQKIIDTHCHYNLDPLYCSAKIHWRKSLENNIVGAVCVGTNIKTSLIAIKLAKQFKTMFSTIGIHPGEYTEKIKSILDGDSYSQSEIDLMINDDIDQFTQLTSNLKTNSKIIAVGEIGLDYFWLKNKGLKRQLVEDMQRKMFSSQLELAFENNLPVILHVRDQTDRTENNAYCDVYEIFSNLKQKYSKQNKKIPSVILHCASGPKKYIENFLKIGAYIGFAGNITYDNAPELKEILKITPKDKILLETDAPYLAPLNNKGKTCEPYLIKETAKFLDESYGINIDIITENTLKVFPQFSNVIQ